MEEALLEQLKRRVAEELQQRELALLEFWLGELRKIEARRHHDLASLQSDLKAFMARLETRRQTLKGPAR